MYESGLQQPEATDYLSVRLLLHLPARWQYLRLIRERVHQRHQVAVVLVALKLGRILADSVNYVLHRTARFIYFFGRL